jgi:hypothetical protein
VPPKTGIPPCRLSVILAREAPVGVIFRRGPSKLVELIKWNTDTDNFERGQWFKGRIDERGADLSPDGTLLIYWAEKPQIGSPFNKEGYTCWTAVSRPPWLTAIAFWPGIGPAIGGGGLFIDDKTVWMPYSMQSSPKVRKPDELVVLTEPFLNFYIARLERDGWRGSDVDLTHPREKTDPWGTRKLAMYWNRPRGSGVHSFGLVYSNGAPETPMADTRWADWDQQGRLVFTRDGKVFVGEFDKQGQMTPRELADFNADAFEPREAPAWARGW